MKINYSNIRGTCDFDQSQSLAFNGLHQKAIKIFKVFNYQQIILPILEEKYLFVKGVGKITDIVERQMFKIQGKDDVVLRPEATAQVVRYYLQNSLYRKSDFHKFFYTGPMFRGERPQKGRLRQFHHIGAEAIGSDSIYLDAEIIMLALKILDECGIKEKELRINSLGCVRDKNLFSQRIKASLDANKSNICGDCTKRVVHNPLRVLDCKKSECRKVIGGLDFGSTLCSSCEEQFKNLCSLLRDLGVEYTHIPTLVRGLDYYTNAVFEISSPKLGSQDAIGAGGRYNNLIKSLGGPGIPAVGFALGVERMLIALGNNEIQPKLDVFIAVIDKNWFAKGFEILDSLRKAGFSCDFDYCQKSLKGQLRFAQKKGARFVVIVAEDELKDKSIILKDMSKAIQNKVRINNLISELEKAT